MSVGSSGGSRGLLDDRLGQDGLEARQPRLLLRPNEAAAALAISRSKLYRLIRSGRVQSVMLGGNRRITLESLERLVEELAAVTPDGQDDRVGRGGCP